MAKKRIPIDQNAFEYLKLKVIEISGIKLSLDNAYLDLCNFLKYKSKENFPEPRSEDGKVIQYRESVSIDTLRRYWGEKDADKKITPDVGKLSVLTQAIGYADWETFLKEYKEKLDNEDTKPEVPTFSNPEDINVVRLEVGKVLSFGVPPKYITIELVDDFTFQIVKSMNTSMKEGDKFTALSFQVIKDENLIFPKIFIESFYEDEENIAL